MDLNEVAVFIKVVQKRSFTGAALALDMPKSTVSMKLTSLEKRLGTSLLIRSTRKLRVTPAGEAFFLRVSKSLDDIMAAEVAIRAEDAEPHGKFKITAPLGLGKYVLPDLTAQFLKKHPKVEIEILATNQYVDLVQDGVDIAIRAGNLKDSSLIAKKIGEADFRIFASPKYLKERGMPMTLKDLANHDCINVRGITEMEWKLQGPKRTTTIAVSAKTLVSDISLAQDMAAHGLGVALLPSYACAPDVANGKLVRILTEWRSGLAPVHFVYPAQSFVPVTTKAFIEVATPIMRASLGI